MNIIQNQVVSESLNTDCEKIPLYSLSRNSNSIASIIVDLSPFGGRLLMPDSTRLNSDKIVIHLNLPKQKGNVVLEARILWKKIRVPNYHIEVGCEFIRPSNDTKLKLMQYIRDNISRQRRMIVRRELL